MGKPYYFYVAFHLKKNRTPDPPVSIVRLLLERGAVCDYRFGKKKRTALRMALLSGMCFSIIYLSIHHTTYYHSFQIRKVYVAFLHCWGELIFLRCPYNSLKTCFLIGLGNGDCAELLVSEGQSDPLGVFVFNFGFTLQTKPPSAK